MRGSKRSGTSDGGTGRRGSDASNSWQGSKSSESQATHGPAESLELELLASASQLLASTLDYRITLDNIASLVVTNLADWCTISLARPDGTVERVAGSHREEPHRSTVRERISSWRSPQREAQPLLFEVLDSGTPRLLVDLDDGALAAIGRDPDQISLMRALEVGSLLVVPMLARETTIGVIFMARSRSSGPFQQNHVRLAVELGRRAATALENARLHNETRRLNDELEMRVRERTAQLEETNRRLEREVAERKRAEADLRERERLLRRAQRITQLGSWSYRPGVGELFWSEETCEIFGYDPSIVPSFDLYLISIAPDDRERVGAIIARALEEGEAFEFEHRFMRSNGTVGHARCEGEVTFDDSGKVVEIFGTIQDVTRAMEAEQAIRESEARFRFLAEQSLHVVATIRQDGTIDYVSPSAQQVLGYEPHQLRGTNCLDLIHPDELATATREFRQLLSSPGRGHTLRHRYRHGSGEWRILELHGKLPEESSETAVFNAHDVTERVRADQAIRELNSRLERRSAQLAATNKELETFAYSVSHDLRAPLRAIDGFSRVLEEDFASRLDPAAARYIERIRSGAKRMSDLIDDLLALSRLSRARMELEEVDVSALARQVSDEVSRRHPGREVDLRIEPGMKGVADRRLLTVVLDNLLDNAWKFTRRSEEPRVEVGRLEEEGEAFFFVRDNGAGFDMTYSNRLFGAFQRLHSQDDFEGTGVGLATVQRIVNRHGGTIRAEGELGKGATFYFSLGSESQGTREDEAVNGEE